LLVTDVSPASAAPPAAAQSCTSNITANWLIVINGRRGQASHGAVVGDSLELDVKVTSACQIQQVVAEAFGTSTSLSFNAGVGSWVGTMSIAGRPRGDFTLTATATDVNGTVDDIFIQATHDTAPVLTVATPTPYLVARPVLHVSATCIDDAPAGCQAVEVLVNDQFFASVPRTGATNQFEGDVSLAPFEGRELDVKIVGVDSVVPCRTELWNCQGTPRAERTIYVESNPDLVEVAQAPGLILHETLDRMLYRRDDGAAILLVKASGQTTVLADNISYGWLTPRGAIIIHRPVPSSLGSRLREWRDGVASDFPYRINSADSLRVRGNYAVWSADIPSIGIAVDNLFWRDLDTGNTIAIGASSDTADVAANGDVVFVQSGIQRYRNGVTTELASSGFSPITDGINVAYGTLNDPSAPMAPASYTTHLVTPSGSIVLATLDNEPAPGMDYAVNGGWTAFTRDSGAARNVWVRSPAGVETQISFFGDWTRIVALNDDGQVVVRHEIVTPSPSRNRLLLGGPGRPLTDFAMFHFLNGAPRVFWRTGYLHVIIGGSVFRVAGAAGADPNGRNVARASNGGIATAVNQVDAGFRAEGAINGDRRGANIGNNDGWVSLRNTSPAWLQVGFAGLPTIDKVCVISAQDDWRAPIEPTLGTQFSLYGLVDFHLDQWNGSSWQPIPGTAVTGNAQVVRCLVFPAMSTGRIRLVVTRTPDAYSRVIELEAWSVWAPGSTPPAVTLANLTTGPIVAGVTPVQLLADASDSDGNITKVDFYADGQLLGTDSSNAYTLAWTPVQTGTYQLTAVATDNSQTTTTSTPVEVVVVPSPPPNPNPAPNPTRTNVALASNGGVATAVNVYDSLFLAGGANDGDRRGAQIGNNGGWMSRPNTSPAWLQVAFAGVRAIDTACVVGAQDNWRAPIEPHAGTPFTLYGLLDFVLESWSGSAWQPIPGTAVIGNTQVFRCLTFPAISTSRIRVVVTRAADRYTRVIELEAWSAPASQPPVVTLVNATSGPITAGVTAVQLQADASDGDGTVTKVDFYANGDLLGTDASGAYTWVWTPAQAGTYQVTAVATDDSLAATTSTAVQVVVSPNSPTPNPGRTNVALATNGGLATAVNVYGAGFAAAGANDGDRRGEQIGDNGGWMSQPDTSPAWLQVAFTGVQTIGEACVVGTQDNWRAPIEPTSATEFTMYGLVDFDLQSWDGNAWRPILGTTVTNNTKVLRCLTFPEVATSRIRLRVTRTLDRYTRVIELEAWTAPPATSQPPVVTLANLTSGPIVAGVTAVQLQADASDSDGTIATVDFYVNGQLVGTDASTAFTLNWTPALPGTYRFNAVATDNSQATSTSADLDVVVVSNPARTNVALAINGGQATAINQVDAGFRPDGAINGDRRGANIGNDDGWVSQRHTSPAWLQVDFAGSRTIDEACVITAQDNWRTPIEPDTNTQFTLYGLLDFTLQYWDGGAWQVIPGTTVVNNTNVVRCQTFAPVTTSRVRLEVTRTPDGYARVIELEAWGTPP
jgi:hypothetical protein